MLAGKRFTSPIKRIIKALKLDPSQLEALLEMGRVELLSLKKYMAVVRLSNEVYV